MCSESAYIRQVEDWTECAQTSHTQTHKSSRQFHSLHLADIMTTAYNSAYTSRQALNFTFARQAIIVYFDAECWVVM